MLLDNLCTPTIVFIVFAIAHLSLELYDKNYSLALLKVVLSDDDLLVGIVMYCQATSVSMDTCIFASHYL